MHKLDLNIDLNLKLDLNFYVFQRSQNENLKPLIRDISSLYEISKNGSTSFKNLQTAYSLGGREIVTFIQYGYFLDIDIEIEGMLRKLFFKLMK